MLKKQKKLIINKILEESPLFFEEYERLLNEKINNENCKKAHNNYFIFLMFKKEFYNKMNKENSKHEELIRMIVDILTLIEKINGKITQENRLIDKECKIILLLSTSFKRKFYKLIDLFFTKSFFSENEMRDYLLIET